MSYRSYDYQCEKCGETSIELVPRDKEPTPLACTCGGVKIKLFGVPSVMRAAYPDGTNRFADLKIQRKLQRAKADAKLSGDRESEKKLSKEISKTGGKK